MKKFLFPLGRVLDWRRAQARLEEAKLHRLYAELQTLTARSAALVEEQTQSERALLSAGSISGADLAALDTFKKGVAAEQARLALAASTCRQRIQLQIQIAMQKRRDARLIEKLEQRKLTAWKAGLLKEIDQQAEELHLAKRRMA